MTTSYNLVAGDTLSFGVSAPTAADGSAYAASDGWALTYRLIPRDGAGSVITLSAIADGDDFKVQATAAMTAAWGAGWYSVAAYVTKGTDTYTVEPAFDQARILANPRTAAAGFDGRSQTQKALDDIASAMADAAGRAASSSGSTVVEYEIAGRRMKYANAEEAVTALKAMEHYWSGKRREEITAEARRRGLANPWQAYTVTRRA